MSKKTHALFYDDPYLKEFKAKILEIRNENEVILDQTAFYPGGGGQPADTGFLIKDDEKIRVTRARKDGALIVHECDRVIPWIIGEDVEGIIDWEHRYRVMRYHTLLHILSAIIEKEYGAKVTGGQIYPNKARMDFELEKITPEMVEFLENTINALIKESHPVKTYYVERENLDQHPELIRTKVNLLPENIKRIRIVEIEGIDIQADGGTHVSNTTELSPVKIVKRENKGKGRKRMYIQFLDDIDKS